MQNSNAVIPSDDEDNNEPNWQTGENQRRWIGELTASNNERKPWLNRGAEIMRIYQTGNKDEKIALQKKNYNLFATNADMLMAALFARIPQPDCSRTFKDANDQVGRVASNIAQRVLYNELKNESEQFGEQFRSMIFDWRVPGAGIGWVRYEEQTQAPVELTTDENEMSLLAESDEADFNPATASPIVLDQRTPIDYVQWQDFRYSPCRTFAECRWVSRDIPMTKEALEARFSKCDPEILSSISYSGGAAPDTPVAKAASLTTASALLPKYDTEETCIVVEIWDKEEKKVWWVTEGASAPLDCIDDPHALPNFFPTPGLLANTTTSNYLPIPPYERCKDQYEALSMLESRAWNLTRAIKAKGFYNKAIPELKTALQSTGENDMTPVTNWGTFTDGGKTAGGIDWMPIDQFSKVLGEVNSQMAAKKAQIYELEGINDIMRAAPTPYESGKALQQKADAASPRLTVLQQKVADYVTSLIRIKAHLIFRYYDDQRILQRVGKLPDADQPFVQQALVLLRNELLSSFNVEVSTDTLEMANWNNEQAERTACAQAVASLLREVIPGLQSQPAMAPFGVAMIQFVVAGYKAGKDLEAVLDQSMQQAIQAAQQAQNKPPQPTPEQIKAQSVQSTNEAMVQIAQLKTQSAETIAKMNAMNDTLMAQNDHLRTLIQAQKIGGELELDRGAAIMDLAKANDQADIAKTDQHIDLLSEANAQANNVAAHQLAMAQAVNQQQPQPMPPQAPQGMPPGGQ